MNRSEGVRVAEQETVKGNKSLTVPLSRREEQFQRREQIIKKKDLELQENLIRFNKFLQVNTTINNVMEEPDSQGGSADALLFRIGKRHKAYTSREEIYRGREKEGGAYDRNRRVQSRVGEAQGVLVSPNPNLSHEAALLVTTENRQRCDFVMLSPAVVKPDFK